MVWLYSMTHRRLQREFDELKKDTKLQGEMKKNSVYDWDILMKGPPDSPYENGCFWLNITFSADHPFKPPNVHFKTRIYHPNINETGSICIDILKDKWTPVFSATKIIIALQALLNDPNPHDPLLQDVADLYLNDRDEYNARAKLWTRMYGKVELV